MTKSQSNKAFKTASGMQATTGNNAQSSYNAAVGDIGDYKSALANYAAQNPFVQGGQFETATNQQMSDTAAAGSKATEQAVTGSMVRSGLNPTAGVAAAEQVAQENARTQMGEEARANEARLQGLSGYNASVLAGSAKPEEMQADLTRTELGGSSSALNAETEASKTPSFWQQLGPALISAGGQVGAAYCPAEGSLYLMGDGSEKPVEQLQVGDQVLGIDGDPETIEEIQRARSKVLRIETEGGYVLRCSRVHAFALPSGGFVCATRALGKRIVTGGESGLVTSVVEDGEAVVYNVITDGSHTYRANGLWSLGVGEAERQVSMDEWNRIAEGVR